MERAKLFEINVDLITGVMLGIEFPPVEGVVNEDEEDLQFCMVIDLLVFRVMVTKWKEAE